MNAFWVRLLVVLTVILGINYIAWRWLESLNWEAWWIAVPLVAAETYSLIDVALFGLTVWRVKRRTAPEPPVGATVDVFITTYNEPIELVMNTALAAEADEAERTIHFKLGVKRPDDPAIVNTLKVVDEQLAFLADAADDARLRAGVAGDAVELDPADELAVEQSRPALDPGRGFGDVTVGGGQVVARDSKAQQPFRMRQSIIRGDTAARSRAHRMELF